MDREVLVTGGAGAIGSNLVAALLARQAGRVSVLDDLSSAVPWNLPVDPRVNFIRGSICDPAARELAFNARPTVVFHLAAFFANQNSVDHPEDDLEVNGRGCLALLRDCQRLGVERVVYASTSAIDDGLEAGTAPGRVELLLKTPYQITKALGEFYGYYFHREQGLSFSTVRIFNSYGPGELPGPYRNVIPNFIHRALRGLPLPVIGDGSSSRDYTYVGDIVAGFLAAAARPDLAGRCLRLSSGVSTSALELAQTINRLTGNPAGISQMPVRSWETLHRHFVPGSPELPEWRATVDLETGLSKTVNWFRSHQDRIDAALGA
ncbi:MAG: NAD-dependent epimerase/dehydratase family protein [Candidatus Delongbacteria bacterium]